MGKILDTRIVEYAYVTNFTVLKNVSINNNGNSVNNVRITITYELKDANKVLLNLIQIAHYISVDGIQTDAQTMAIVLANFDALVSADKLELSGYQP